MRILNKLLIIVILITFTLLLGDMVFAQDYVPLSGAKELGLSGNKVPSFGVLLNTFFRWGVLIGGILAVLMIIFGGIQYMSTDAISGKKDGRERIKQAVFGLLIVLSTILILNTINPRITSFNLVIDGVTGSSKPYSLRPFDLSSQPWTGVYGDFGFIEGGNATSFGNTTLNDYLLDAIKESDLVNLRPADAHNFFPNGEVTAEGWAKLITAMAKLESDHNPALEFPEFKKDGTPWRNNDGEQIVSTGLLQLSYESVRLYGDGQFENFTTETLKNPILNLRAGVEILETLVKKDGYISGPNNGGGARYWAVLQEDKGKVQQISKTLLKEE